MAEPDVGYGMRVVSGGGGCMWGNKAEVFKLRPNTVEQGLDMWLGEFRNGIKQFAMGMDESGVDSLNIGGRERGGT